MLDEYNEGRSKSFYCISTALLPIIDLKFALNNSEHKIGEDNIKSDNLKAKSKILKDILIT